MTACAIAGYGITPAHAPLPIDCSLRFQPLIGSQNSVLMSESAVGLSETATRQKAGRLPIVAFGLVAPGGAKLPVTTAALVTVPLAMDSDFKPSHDCGVCANTGVADTRT